MSRSLPSDSIALVASLILCLGCNGLGQTVAQAKDGPAAAPCPAGQAVVQRGGTTLRVSIVDAFAKAQDNDRIQLGAGHAVATETLTMTGVRGVTITGPKTSLVAITDITVVEFSHCDGVTLKGVHVVHETGEWCAHT